MDMQISQVLMNLHYIFACIICFTLGEMEIAVSVAVTVKDKSVAVSLKDKSVSSHMNLCMSNFLSLSMVFAYAFQC